MQCVPKLTPLCFMNDFILISITARNFEVEIFTGYQCTINAVTHYSYHSCLELADTAMHYVHSAAVMGSYSCLSVNGILVISPNFAWNRDGIAVFSKKTAISLKRRRIGPRLLIGTEINDLGWPWTAQYYALCFKIHAFFEPTTKIWMKIRNLRRG